MWRGETCLLCFGCRWYVIACVCLAVTRAVCMCCGPRRYLCCQNRYVAYLRSPWTQAAWLCTGTVPLLGFTHLLIQQEVLCHTPNQHRLRWALIRMAV